MKNHSAPRLLWIDDEISPCDAEVAFLHRQGFQIECVVTGCDGLARARSREYDGILLDLKLPDLPGLSILATLRAEQIVTPSSGFNWLRGSRVCEARRSFWREWIQSEAGLRRRPGGRYSSAPSK